jgi:hypothetical protein
LAEGLAGLLPSDTRIVMERYAGFHPSGSEIMRTTILVVGMAAGLGLAVPVRAEVPGPPDDVRVSGQAGQAQGQGKGQDASPAQQGKGQGAAQAQEGKGKGQTSAQAQGKGKGQTPAQAQGKGQGQSGARSARGGGPPDPAVFNRNLVEKAIRTRGRRAGQAANVSVRREGGQVRVVRDDGDVLFTLAESTADNLGYWRAAVVPPTDRRGDIDLGDIFGTSRDRYPADDRGEGPPAFCRSGAGHPVWGRDWCLDKGFGLGERDRRWGATTDIGDIILRRPDPQRDVLDRGGLIDVLGDIVFGRLAMQSLVLGADEPLEGRWIGQPEGPRILRVHAGTVPVAEVVDYGRDDSVDRIVFNLGG